MAAAVRVNSKRGVILLRDVKLPTDRYKEILEFNGYTPEFIPVLDFNFIDNEGLIDAFSHSDRYSGMVFTSQVAVEAVANITTSTTEGSWSNSPVFVVGTATKTAVKKLLNLDGIGEGCGNGRSLGQFIVDYYRSHLPDRPLLFPCGNIRKDCLPSLLSSANVPLHCQTCYETVPHPLIETRLSTVCSPPYGIVFFSPSGVKYAFDVINRLLLSHDTSIKVCAIGPSTGESLMKECQPLSIPVHVASNPTPEDLLSIINNEQ